MSQRTAQLIIVAIFAARIAAGFYGAIPDTVETQFDALLVLVQGWMTHQAYNRNPDGSPLTGTGDGK